MKFKKEWLLEELDEDNKVSHKLVDRSRWTVTYRWVFTFEGKFYAVNYSTGATESQDEGPFEYFKDDDEIECKEVFARKKEIIVYE